VSKSNKKKSQSKPDSSPGKNVLEEILAAAGDESNAYVLGSNYAKMKVRGVIGTQLATVDAAMGRGGIPLGRLTVLHGAESSGKTTLALHIVSETQSLGGVAVYIDKECKLDPDYAKQVGVDTDHLIISQPDDIERIFSFIDGITLRASKIREIKGRRIPILIVLDSINPCKTKAQIEAGYGVEKIGDAAGAFSRYLPKVMPKVFKEDVALLFISQVRTKIGVAYGDKEEISGGWATKHHATIVAYVRRATGSEKDEDGVKTAHNAIVDIRKNQIFPPFRKAPVVVRYGQGFDKSRSLIVQCERDGILTRSGAWYSRGDDRLANGIDSTVALLNENDQLRSELLSELRTKHGWEYGI